MKKYTYVHENEPFAKGKFTNENYLFGQKILRLDKIDFDWRKNRPLTIDFHKKKCSIYYGFLLVSKLVSLYTDQRLKKSP